MSRLLIAVLALSALGYLAFRTLYGRAASVDGEAQPPQEQLQNVREAARGIEQKERQRADELEKKTE